MTKKKEHVGQCKLCLTEGVKLCNSHIVPEFCYKPIYNDKHKVIRANITKAGIKHVDCQKGHYEPLLCEGCEKKIHSSYEQPFHRYWYLSRAVPQKVAADHIEVYGVDYKTMKLFHLSVIWRVSVSKTFSHMSLGSYYSEKIRQMLYDGNPGPDDHFPIFGRLLLDNDRQVVHPIVTTPLEAKFDENYAYCMCYAGCEWRFLITDHPTQKQKNMSLGLRNNGVMLLDTCHYLSAETSDYFINKLAKAKKTNSS